MLALKLNETVAGTLLTFPEELPWLQMFGIWSAPNSSAAVANARFSSAMRAGLGAVTVP